MTTIILILIGAAVGFFLGRSSKQPIIFIFVGAAVGFAADYLGLGAILQPLLGKVGIGGGGGFGGGIGGVLGQIGSLLGQILPWLGLLVKVAGFVVGLIGAKESNTWGKIGAAVTTSMAFFAAYQFLTSLIPLPGMAMARTMTSAGGSGILGTVGNLVGNWFSNWAPLLQ